MRMGIFERMKSVEEKAFKIEKKEGDLEREKAEKEEKEKSRKNTIQEMIENEHPLVKEIKDPHWIKKTTEKYGNTGSLKKNIGLACEKTSEETGLEPDFVMDVFKTIQEEEERKRKEMEKEILEKRRQGKS